MSRSRSAVVLLAFVVVHSAACERRPKTEPTISGAGGKNFLFITLDTTRADRLGCYGYRAAVTPALDTLAKRGVLFERAYCEAPITLASHCSMMTGLYPREHGIRVNGSASLRPQYATLATLFKKKGYRTGGFVAAYVLNARFGLHQGFETFCDDMGTSARGGELLDLQIPANVVTDRTLSWLESVKEEPFFCWVHYYDPHDPYAPPPEFQKSPPNAYDGEIAFVDSQIRRVLDFLAKAGIAEKTVVIVAGDHGEAFGEHREEGHTLFLYQTNIHVPLLFAGPGIVKEVRVENPVELVGIFPTVVELAGLEMPAGATKESFAAALSGKAISDRECYSESHYGFDSYGFAEQRALTTRDWKYISSARPELYDLRGDAEERRNLVAEKAEIARELLTRLLDKYEAMPEGEAIATAPSAKERTALAGLGYVSGGGAKSQFLTQGLPDPKDLLPVVQKVELAKGAVQNQRIEEGLAILESVVRESPRSFQIYFTLGCLYSDAGRFEEAIPNFEKALALRPDRAETRYNFGIALLRMNEPVRAGEHLREAVRLKPDYGEAWVNLGVSYGMQGKLDESKSAFEKAMTIAGAEADAHFNWGVTLEKAGRTAEARAQYGLALQRSPGHARAIDALVKLSFSERRSADAIRVLREAIRHIPDNMNFANLLATVLATSRDDGLRNGAEALQIATAACEKTEFKHPVLLGTLACAYAENGRFEEAQKTVKLAIDLAQSSGQVNLMPGFNEQLSAYQQRRPYRNPRF